MEKQWQVKLVIDKEECPFEFFGNCTIVNFGDGKCTYEKCPRRVPRTCKDCKYLFFNQNPEEEIADKLTSMCGVKGYENIHTAENLEQDHYKVPGWCPVNYDVSNVEVLELVED